MSQCFVMQPFDGDKFDRRFEEVFAPAIREAGLEPYRVDQDPHVSIPIQDIESGIRDARLCLADITLDNPNVWFELGFAIACRKEVVLLCSDERTSRFPFDIQHRTIIKYSTKSPSDYKKLQEQIVQRVKAYLEKSETLASVSEMTEVTTFEGLQHHEVVAIAALAENLQHPDDHASTFQIKRDMEASGYTKVAATLALKGLISKDFISFGERQDDQTGEYYPGYSFTEKGWAWTLANQDRFVLKKKGKFEDFKDDIPF